MADNYQTLVYNRTMTKAQSNQMLPRNDNRIAVEVYPPAAGCLISPGIPASATSPGTGFSIPIAANTPYRWDIVRHGDIVRSDWHFFATATVDLSYCEVVKVPQSE